MIRYITRHGQISTDAAYDGSHMYPSRDMPLSPLGRKQATLLGKRMKQMGFKGRILASPFHRTLETATLIAAEVGVPVIPYGPIHEIIRSQEFLTEYKGHTMDDIRAQYPHIDPEATLVYPWWSPALETKEDVLERVRKGVALAEETYPDEEILYVGHGASCNALMKLYDIPRKGGFPYNCFLSSADPKDADYPKVFCDCTHIPYTETTSNFLTAEERDRQVMDRECRYDVTLPEWLKDVKGPVLLHIGDTPSQYYPYFFKLIEAVKPDILLHTGDLSDEVKVGRIVGTVHEYLVKSRVLIEKMRQAGARRLIIVPGNNDLPDEIARMAPDAEIYPVNTLLTIDGIPCRVGHQVFRMTFDTAWSFYGHGPTRDDWRPRDNRPGEPCRFNATFGSFVCCLSEGKFFHIPYPWEQ